MANYASIFTGEQIDKAVATYLNGGINSGEEITVNTANWDPDGSGTARFVCTIQLQGTYDVGLHPIVTFVDNSNISYNTTYKFNSSTSISVYSNANISGKISMMGKTSVSVQ